LFAGVYYLYKKADRSEMNSYMSQGADYAKMAGIEVVRGIKELKEINELKESSGQWKDDAANQTATASIEMPGVKSPEITVIDDKRLIKIKGLRKEIEETVENTVSVPEHVNISTLRVHMADGLLHLTASTIREGRVLQLDNEPGYQKL
jgi:HSP20 family molecular chaperone IbpA